MGLYLSMQDRPNYRKYTLPPVSRKYLFRILIYLFLLALLAGIAIYSRGTHRNPNPEDIHEIHQVEIEVPNTDLSDTSN